MRYPLLRKLRERSYFTVEDLQDLLRIKPESARVLCTRYNRNGFFIRLKKNFYVLTERWENFSKEDFLKISNFLQVPSYISFLTALSLYEVTTQVQRNYFESVSLKRSVRFNIKGVTFNFYKLKKKYYFDFIKKDDIFIATREKAFIDSVYLYSFGKYKIDFSSLDLDKLDKNRIKKILRLYPQKTKSVVEKICGI
jgi:predicted transcriptional regulator of viral defense system